MFDKLLIANRGEIACRVIKTCRRLGIRTVAVYSEADAGARHVRLADEAILIGPPAANESYLSIERILDAARQTGARAIHPGYGFLSENAEFAEACAAAGIVFVGPPAAAIRAMGSKAAAKTLMEKAGVPLVPGYHGDKQDAAFLAGEAQRIGYPVLIKASAGGGGKGMRIVRDPGEFHDALASCRREAAASFGDARVLLEKYLTRPRHIEMQVFADSHGNIVHLFERDCSVQRRHQKVLEEAPAPGMTPQRRAAMGHAAIEAARSVGYVGAGTVEFIVDEDERFYFMEMNTRLQVEHPVTEMITGLDLVEWQLKVGAGETLPLAQEQIAMRGHAIEARIYAEDPDRGFLPATGRLIHLVPPAESPHVRVDSGVEQGDAITPHYDPMIAKLIVWDDRHENARDAALKRMLQALAQYRVVGVANNVEFLSRLVSCPAFAAADLDTGLIEREHDFLFPVAGEGVDVPRAAWLACALAELLREEHVALAAGPAESDPHSPWRLRDGWRANGVAERRLLFRGGEIERSVSAISAGSHWLLALADTSDPPVPPVPAAGRLDADGALCADIGGTQIVATVVAAGERRHVFLHGRCHVLAAVDPLYHAGAGGGHGGSDGGLTAPMPGKVVALLVEPGARVAKGAALMILEAMKMEHAIVAPEAGVVRRFRFALGDQVADGEELVEFELDQQH